MSIIKKNNRERINWLDVLPKNAAKKVKALLPNGPSERQLHRILTGESPDLHGVIALANKMASDHARELKKQADKKAKLQKRVSQLKSK